VNGLDVESEDAPKRRFSSGNMNRPDADGLFFLLPLPVCFDGRNTMNEESIQGRQDSADLYSPCRLRARRNLKIEDLTDPFSRRRTIRAGIRLKGQWLTRAGFRPGERVAVILVEPGIMQLRVIPESAQRVVPRQSELVLQGELAPRNSKED